MKSEIQQRFDETFYEAMIDLNDLLWQSTSRFSELHQLDTFDKFYNALNTNDQDSLIERDTEVTKDTMHPTNNGSTEDVPPPVVPIVYHESISEPANTPVSALRPNQKASIPFPSRRNDERRRDILLFEAILNSEPIPPLQGNYFPDTRKDLKICEANHENSSVNEPPELELKDLPPHLEYAFLEGDDKLPVIIAKDLKN
ncbi:hypothetical protein Tco_0940388 [Tanacetum coccineum]|uniref:Reverse transcriptase domain-containing protein n=1 Tax=Tanacetum coccineum TaxID=301880 RepID=A0ABQ5DNS4_9ASTR